MVNMGLMGGDQMRVLVCGGRDFEDDVLLFKTLDALEPTLIIEGGQRKWRNGVLVGGADYWAYRWATLCGVSCMTVEAHWHDLETPPVVRRIGAGGKPYNAAAGGIRNAKMLEELPELVLAFPGGPGTADMVQRAEAVGVEVRKVGW